MPRRNAIPRNEAEAQEREQALAALALMRREEKSRSAAARAKNTAPSRMQRYVGSALRKDSSGRYHATPWDRIPRHVKFLTPQGEIPLTVRDSRTASKIGEHRSAFGIFVRTGDIAALERFKKTSFRVGGEKYTFITDTATLAHIAAGGNPPVEGLYQAVLAP